MEESALGIARFLQLLVLPVGVAGTAVGLFTAIRFLLRNPRVRHNAGVVEALAVGLCGGVAALGILGLVESFRSVRPDFPPLAAAFTVAILFCGLPAILWKSRWRVVAEGIATLSLSIGAILSSFTIGFLLVPLMLLMIWVCYARLRAAYRSRTLVEAATSEDANG
jgi:TRAP-type C4-dicarboxylate transport system permease small subunit